MKLPILVAGFLLCFLVYSSDQLKRGARGCKRSQQERLKREAGKPEGIPSIPWSESAKCSKFEIKSSTDGTRDSGFLIGDRDYKFSRTIEKSTGVFVGNVRGQRQETPAAVGKPILRNVPFNLTRLAKGGGSKSRILYLRNPLKSIFLFGGINLLSRGNVGNAKNKKASEVQRRLVARAHRWVANTKAWLPSGDASAKKFLLIQEDAFDMHPQEELERLHKFLGVPVSKERMQCVIDDLNSNKVATKKYQRFGRNVRPAVSILRRGIAGINKSLQKYKNVQPIKLNFEF